MSIDTDDLPAVEALDRSRRWPHPFVVVAAALALLTIGDTGGLLIGRAGQPTIPGAGSVDVGFLQDMSAHHASGDDEGLEAQHHRPAAEAARVRHRADPERAGRPQAGLTGAVARTTSRSGGRA